MMLFLVRHTGPWVLYVELFAVPSQYRLKSNYIHHSSDLKYYSYCSPVWRPHLIKDIKKLEQLQHRATKYILNYYLSDYKTQLTHLSLLPLMYIFEISDIATIFYQKPQEPSQQFQHRHLHLIFCLQYQILWCQVEAQCIINKSFLF